MIAQICPSPEREGPVFFGDEHRSQVLSYTFLINDSQSRGQKSFFSITVVMMDKTFLLNSWPFLVKNIRLVVEDLKAKSNAVYNEEMARHPSRRSTQGTACPTSAASYRLQRGSGKAKSARSLTELTGDRLIFNHLHRAFTWLLKAGGVRLTERLLEGPPTEGCLLDTSRVEGQALVMSLYFAQEQSHVVQVLHMG